MHLASCKMVKNKVAVDVKLDDHVLSQNLIAASCVPQAKKLQVLICFGAVSYQTHPSSYNSLAHPSIKRHISCIPSL